MAEESPKNKPVLTKFLRPLGIIGVDRIDAVVLAAIASEVPLLLIGAHGTAKSLLLTRISEALGLEFRHYNASLLNYDDLVGYPLPDASGGLKFVETPASIWPAEAVLVDEISRCRPDMQNRLFPIIHEKRVQGMLLPKLRFRWAAMNPPPSLSESAADAAEYLGSEALDVALADRFPFVIEMPTWQEFSTNDRMALVRSPVEDLAPEVVQAARSIVEQTRERILHVEAAFSNLVAEYCHLIEHALAPLKIRLSGRRGWMLHNAICAVHAARWTLGARTNIDESAWIALKNAIPDRAWGAVIEDVKVQLVHRRVCETLHMEHGDPRRLLVQETDPVNRALMAIGIDALAGNELSAHVADALASCELGARHLLAATLSAQGAIARLNPAIAEQIAILVGELEVGCTVAWSIGPHSGKHDAYKAIVRVCGADATASASTVALNNLLLRLLNEGQCSSSSSIERTVAAYRSMEVRLETRRAA